MLYVAIQAPKKLRANSSMDLLNICYMMGEERLSNNL